MFPTDSHVHSQWSWDALDGSMKQTCQRAVDIGLPAVAFTEHMDFAAWKVLDAHLEVNAKLRELTDAEGMLTPPPLDVEGYLESVQRCREMYPGLRIITGVELGEPHRHGHLAADLLGRGRFERILGSLHSLPLDGQLHEPAGLFQHRDPSQVMREYLTEIPRVIAGSDTFSVLAHIDYPVRAWPAAAGTFDPYAFEDEFRYALRSLAETGRALEVNTRVPLGPEILTWWREEGGDAVTFGSDAHSPEALARGFTAAAEMVEAHGFRPGRHPYDIWYR